MGAKHVFVGECVETDPKKRVKKRVLFADFSLFGNTWGVGGAGVVCFVFGRNRCDGDAW